MSEDIAWRAWRCPVRLDGLVPPLPDIGGEDTLQALLLALRVAHRELAQVEATGAKLQLIRHSSGGNHGDHRMTASGLRFFWMLTAAGALFVALTFADLPATVATNFAGSGVPHAWMGRQVYAGYLAIIGVVLPLLTVAVVSRRGGTQSAQWRLGSLLVGFALGVHVLILEAHRARPPQLSTPGFLAVLGLFVAGLAIWIVHWRRSGHRAG